MAKILTDQNLINETLTRSVDKVYPTKEDLEKALSSGRRLKIYLGVDPTGPHLHLGHLTNLLTLKRFQDLGHELIFLIGDFTGTIGDPTDKLSPRQPLTREQVKENLKTFKKQASKIINFSGANSAKVKFNSKWLTKLNLGGVLELVGHFTAQQILDRDMFQERLKQNKPINLREFFYPLMQGYDSVVLDVDLEIGGTDQTFNMLIGRDLMKIYKSKDKFVLTTKLLENPKTGKKLMNKSEGGLINLDDAPNDIFGKVMALDDSAIVPVAEFSTNLPLDQVRTIKAKAAGNPKEAKMATAEAVVETIYGQAPAQSAREEFIKVFSKKETPAEIEIKEISKSDIEIRELLVLVGFAQSKGFAGRLIKQGGVKIDGKTVDYIHEIIKLNATPKLLQVGPKKFLKIIHKEYKNNKKIESVHR